MVSPEPRLTPEEESQEENNACALAGFYAAPMRVRVSIGSSRDSPRRRRSESCHHDTSHGAPKHDEIKRTHVRFDGRFVRGQLADLPSANTGKPQMHGRWQMAWTRPAPARDEMKQPNKQSRPVSRIRETGRTRCALDPDCWGVFAVPRGCGETRFDIGLF
jgi:hypothetical protein